MILWYLLSAFALIIDIESHGRDDDNDDEEDWDEDSRGRGGLAGPHVLLAIATVLANKGVSAPAGCLLRLCAHSAILTFAHQGLVLKWDLMISYVCIHTSLTFGSSKAVSHLVLLPLAKLLLLGHLHLYPIGPLAPGVSRHRWEHLSLSNGLERVVL